MQISCGIPDQIILPVSSDQMEDNPVNIFQTTSRSTSNSCEEMGVIMEFLAQGNWMLLTDAGRERVKAS